MKIKFFYFFVAFTGCIIGQIFSFPQGGNQFFRQNEAIARSNILDQIPIVSNLTGGLDQLPLVSNLTNLLDQLPLVSNLTGVLNQLPLVSNLTGALNQLPLVSNLTGVLNQLPLVSNLTDTLENAGNLPLLNGLVNNLPIPRDSSANSENLPSLNDLLGNLPLVNNLPVPLLQNGSNVLNQLPLVSNLTDILGNAGNLPLLGNLVNNLPLLGNSSLGNNLVNLSLVGDLVKNIPVVNSLENNNRAHDGLLGLGVLGKRDVGLNIQRKSRRQEPFNSQAPSENFNNQKGLFGLGFFGLRKRDDLTNTDDDSSNPDENSKNNENLNQVVHLLEEIRKLLSSQDQSKTEELEEPLPILPLSEDNV